MTALLENDHAVKQYLAAMPLAEFKAEETAGGEGIFAARISVFGNNDLNGDRVLRGAFKRTIAEWRAKGQPVPVIESHAHDDMGKLIGEVNPIDMKETGDSFVAAGRMFLKEGEPNRDRARQVFDLMKRGLITAWSYAFTVPQGGDRIAKDGIREILDLDLIEVGPTLVGANPKARTIALKALIEPENKRGRRHSAATLAVLTRMRQELDDLLVDESDDDTAEASAEELSETDRLRLSLAEIDTFLAERGRG